MAFSHGTSGRIWMDGFASSCSLNEVTVEGEIDVAETTTLCQTAKTYIPGLQDATIEMAGFFDSNTISPTTTFEFFLNARRRTTFPISFFPEGGGTIGDPAYLLNGFLTTYSVETTVEDAAMVELEWQSSNGLLGGKVLTIDGARTATDADGEGSIDNLVSSANGGLALLSVSAASGTTPTLDVKLEHSSDGSSWADVTGGAFTQQNAVNGELISFSGTINRHVRAVWTIAGGTPSFTFNVSFRRN